MCNGRLAEIDVTPCNSKAPITQVIFCTKNCLKSIGIGLKIELKAEMQHTIYTCKNAFVFRASWAKPRLFFDNQGKNAQHSVKFSLGIFLFKNENACFKNLKRCV